MDMPRMWQLRCGTAWHGKVNAETGAGGSKPCMRDTQHGWAAGECATWVSAAAWVGTPQPLRAHFT